MAGPKVFARVLVAALLALVGLSGRPQASVPDVASDLAERKAGLVARMSLAREQLEAASADPTLPHSSDDGTSADQRPRLYVQWYNWPNWNNWPNWPNFWNNFWRNY